MIFLKTDEEVELMRASNILLGKTYAEVAKAIKPGVTTAQLDKIAYEFIMDNGGRPACLGYEEYPATLCTSVNEVVVHGIPSDKVILHLHRLVHRTQRLALRQRIYLPGGGGEP